MDDTELIRDLNEKFKTQGKAKFRELHEQLYDFGVAYEYLKDSEIKDILNDEFKDEEHKKAYISGIRNILHGIEDVANGLFIICNLFDKQNKECE